MYDLETLFLRKMQSHPGDVNGEDAQNSSVCEDHETDRIQSRSSLIETGKQELRNTLVHIDMCIDELTLKLEAMIRDLFNYGQDTICELKKLRSRMEEHINDLLSETEEAFYQKLPRNFEPGKNAFQLFSYKFIDERFPHDGEEVLTFNSSLLGPDWIPPLLSPRASSPLVVVSPTHFQHFSPSAMALLPRVQLHTKIEVDQFSATVMIGPNLFVCGGGSATVDTEACMSQVDKSAYILDSKGSVRQQPNMREGRACPGLIYFGKGHSVFAFGGKSRRTHTSDENARIQKQGIPPNAPGDREEDVTSAEFNLSSSEMFTLFSYEWLQLPEMKHPRASFNPCSYKDQIYLCGGGARQVEVFNPVSQSFEDLSDLQLSVADSYCIAVVEKDSLVAISQDSVCRWDLNTQFLNTQKHSHKSQSFVSACTPVVTGDVVWVLNLQEKSCDMFNLTTGAFVESHLFS